ncbi:MAG: AAA family ATPase [Acidobacteria bacterium]|nr:AAA family ATPase [Acidobacteriota bacterium]
MYTEHFGFQEDPFGVSPDPRFLYLGPAHHEAFAALLYGVKMRRGFICLIGEPGTGKTTLLYALLERLEGKLRTVFLPGTDLTFKQRLQFILESLGANPAGGTVLSLTRQLQDLLADEWRAGSNVVLIFDEAQNLTVREMEDIRLLTNFEIPQAKLLQVILVGQQQLKDKLALPELAQLKQRITVNVNLRPLTLSETAEYIEHRLRVAEWNKPLHTLFSRPVVAAIFEKSRGIPRLINALCHNALLIAYAENKYRVEMPMVEEAAQELDLFEAAQETAPLPVSVRQPAPVAETSARLEEEAPAILPTSQPILAAPPQPEIAPKPVSEPIFAVLPQPERTQTFEPLLELSEEAIALEHESHPMASEFGEQAVALELGREVELTLDVSEPIEAGPEAEPAQSLPVQVGEQALTQEPTPAAALQAEPIEGLGRLEEVSESSQFVPEVREMPESEPEINAELQPAMDLDEEVTLLPEMSEEAELWPEISEESEPAVDLSEAMGLEPVVAEDREFDSEVVELIGAGWTPNGNGAIRLEPEASDELEAVLGRGGTDFSLSSPRPKVNGKFGTALGRSKLSPPALEISRQSKLPIYRVEKSVRMAEEWQPPVSGCEPETPTPVTVAATPLVGRRWLPTHPIGPPLNQVLDELEGYAGVRQARPEPRPAKVGIIVPPATTIEVREARPEPRPADGGQRPQPSLPTLESFEPRRSTESEFQTQLVSGQQIRHSIEPKRLPTAQMVAWMLFVSLFALSFGVVAGIAFGHYFPDIVKRFGAPTVTQEKPRIGVSEPQPSPPATGGGEEKSQPVSPPAPAVQPSKPPSVVREFLRAPSEVRTVTVKKGDDLPRILRREYGYINSRLVRLVQAANPQVKDWDYLEIGQKLKLPLDPEEDVPPSRQGP